MHKKRIFHNYKTLILLVLLSCSKKKDDFVPLKNDFENIFVECRDTNFIYTKEELIEIRSDMAKILKQEGEKW